MSKKAKKARRMAQRKKVQKRFKARVAAGKSGLTGGAKGTRTNQAKRGQPDTSTLGMYRASQRQRISDAARERNQAFQERKAGLDSQTLGAEATRLTNIPSGDDLKPGMLTISDAGKAQAEENKAIKAAKDSTIASSFNYDFNNFANNAAKGFNLLTTADKLAPKGGLSSYYMSGNRPNMSFMDAYNLEKGMQQQTGKFDPNRKFNLASYARGESNPFRGMPGYGTIKSLVNPRIRNINYNRMLQGKSPLSMDKVNPGGFQTAPTEFTRRVLPGVAAFLPGYNIGSKLFNEGQTGSALDKSLKNVDNINVGGLSIGFNSPESTDIGAQAGRFFTSIPGKIANLFSGEAKAETTAGGLNVSGATDTAENDKTGRTLTARFKKPGFDTFAGGLDFITDDRYDFDNLGKGLFGYGAVTPSNVINDAMSIAQNKNLTVKDMGTFLNTVKDISTSDDKLGTVQNIISNPDTTARLLGPVYDQLRNSEIVDSLATKKLKLPDNYGEQLDATKGALETAYKNLGTDDKKNRRIISDLFIGKNPDLNLLKRAAEQLTNESGTIANYDTKSDLAKFQDSFNEGAPLFRGLNKDERGIIGSLGNWRLSNLGTKIVGSNLEGTNNVADLASNIIDTAATNKATQSFLKTLPDKGAPTPKSIIGGALPRFTGRNTGVRRFNSTSAAPTSQQEIPLEEILPLTPGTVQQMGTNNNNLSQIQQQAYNNQMSTYGVNPNYFAQIRQTRFNRPLARFRQTFNRDYFSQFV